MAGQLDLARSSHDPWGFEVPFDAAGLLREADPAWPVDRFEPENLAWEDASGEAPESLDLAEPSIGAWSAETDEAGDAGEGAAELGEADEAGDPGGGWAEAWGESAIEEAPAEGFGPEGFDEASPPMSSGWFEADEAPLAFEHEQFASGLALQRTTAPTTRGSEHWDPNNAGLPLLATGPDVQGRQISRSFTVRDLVTTGGRASSIARISPELVRVLEAIADRAGRRVRITSGYRSWARNVAVYAGRGTRPTKSRHCSGQAADIKVAGMGGVALAKLAIDAVGPDIAIGIGRDFIHVDVRGQGITWPYAGSTGRAEVAEVERHRAVRRGRGPTPVRSPMQATTSVMRPATPIVQPPPNDAGLAGRLVVQRHPMLQGHAGTPPDLVLRWNRISTGLVDVVVHLHGFSGKRGGMELPRDKEPLSGLDFVNPDAVDEIGRTRPTLGVLPRGRYYGGRSGMGYDFPALTRPGAIDELVADALARFAAHTGLAVSRGRLILTAHSGGGAALGQVLAHTDPDEVHVFDGLYAPGTAIVRWAERRIARETAGPSQIPPALRVLYIAGTLTAPHSEHVGRQLKVLLERAGSTSLARVMRVDAVGVDHNHIPRRYGWRLLADPGADLPKAHRYAAPRAVGLRQEGPPETEATYEWALEPATAREASIREADPAWPVDRFEPENLAWEDASGEAPESLDLAEPSIGAWSAETDEAGDAGEGAAELGEADEAGDPGGGWAEAWGESAIEEAPAEGFGPEGFDEVGSTGNRAAGRAPYQPAGQGCTGGPTAGAIALAAQWRRLTGRGSDIYLCRSIRGSTRPSLHGEGRAIDATCNAHHATQRAQGDAYAAWLIQNAVELQVQYVIWNRRQWTWSKRALGWRPYSGVSTHEDHLHIELTWEGAGSPSALFAGPVPGFPGTASSHGPAPARAPASVPGPAPEAGRRLAPRAFVAAYREHAAASHAATGVPALVTLGQAALESGWGERAPRYNFFGIKAKASDPPDTRQLLRTREVFSRRDVTGLPEVISVTPRADGRFTYIVRDWFRAYPSARDALIAHGQFLARNKRYRPAFNHVDDPFAFATAIARAGYATDPSYAVVLHKVMRTLERAGA